MRRKSGSQPLFLFGSVLIFFNFFFVSCHEQKQTCLEFRGVAMTIPYHISVGSKNQQSQEVLQTISSTFQKVDSIFNAYNESSELSQLNQTKGGTTFACSKELFEVLQACNVFYKMSNHRFDPTIKPLEDIWKKAVLQNRVPSESELSAILPTIGWETLTLGNNTVTKTHSLTMLDLGAIAKGYAVDMLAENLRRSGCTSIYVEWGGEIKTVGYHVENRPWHIGIANPSNESPLAVIDIHDTAIATSGDYLQNWKVGKNEYFHVFDPIAKTPLSPTPSSLTSVTVQYESCMVADAIATILLATPSKEQANELLSRSIFPLFPSVHCLMFSHDEGSKNGIVVVEDKVPLS